MSLQTVFYLLKVAVRSSVAYVIVNYVKIQCLGAGGG